MFGIATVAAFALASLATVIHCSLVRLLCQQAPAGVTYPLNGPPANRVSTLTPASVKFLNDIGAWPAIGPPRSTAFSKMQVWDTNGFVRYDTGLFPDPIMGHVAENNVIQQALMQKLEHSGRPVHKLWPVRASCTCGCRCHLCSVAQ